MNGHAGELLFQFARFEFLLFEEQLELLLFAFELFLLDDHLMQDDVLLMIEVAQGVLRTKEPLTDVERSRVSTITCRSLEF